MTDDEKLRCLEDGFEQLPDWDKEYILAISQALLFAQVTLMKEPPTDDRGVRTA